jgi:multiple sugar transport system permease protein
MTDVQVPQIAATALRREAAYGWWDRNERRVTPYLFIAPNVLVFSAFIFLPLLGAVYVSFHRWTLIGVPEFIGLGNYIRIPQDPQFWQALGNTLLYTILTVPASMALGLLVAMGLNRDLPARALLRSLFFVPLVVSGVATGVTAAWLFNDNYGVINALLSGLGLGPVPWLSSGQWALPSLIMTTLWVRLGFCMVVYLAALQTIPTEYHDAAAVDGATRWDRLRHITWPLLAPATFLLLILNVIYSFQVFDLIFVMTGGGPGFATTMLVQYIYQAAFVTSQMGYASALGVVLYAIVLVFTVVQWRASRQGDATR